jgi:hypothetical protein
VASRCDYLPLRHKGTSITKQPWVGLVGLVLYFNDNKVYKQDQSRPPGDQQGVLVEEKWRK